jgi:hypothetical protein
MDNFPILPRTLRSTGRGVGMRVAFLKLRSGTDEVLTRFEREIQDEADGP